MSSVIFQSGDEPFLQWMSDNPDGYVINTSSGNGTSYLMFHKSECHHISTYTRSQAKGAFTEHEYIKVCALDPEDLVIWARAERKGVIDYKICKSCTPEIDLNVQILPEEAEVENCLIEGAKKEIKVNSYERNSQARDACLEYFGYSCNVCGLNFEETYGTECRNFIHVHHLVPLSEVSESYEVDPIKDLRPVCPNCHAVIHLGKKTRDIDTVKNMLENQESKT